MSAAKRSTSAAKASRICCSTSGAMLAAGAGALLALLAALELARRHRRRRLRAATLAMVAVAPSLDPEAGEQSPVAMRADGPAIGTRFALADGGTAWARWEGGERDHG